MKKWIFITGVFFLLTGCTKRLPKKGNYTIVFKEGGSVMNKTLEITKVNDFSIVLNGMDVLQKNGKRIYGEIYSVRPDENSSALQVAGKWSRNIIKGTYTITGTYTREKWNGSMAKIVGEVEIRSDF